MSGKRRGPKPAPTHLKLLRNNPGKRPINRREPKPPSRIPTCPEHLTAGAKKEWKRITKQLDAAGLLTELDRAGLAGYCTAYARWCDAETKLATFGVVIKSPNNWPIQSPYLAIANKAMAQILTFLAEFGLSPSARTRLEVEKPDHGDGDPADNLRDEAKKRTGRR